MKEYIIEFGSVLCNEETGEVAFNPKVKGELIRCKDCKHYAGEGKRCDWDICIQVDRFYCYYGERKEE